MAGHFLPFSESDLSKIFQVAFIAHDHQRDGGKVAARPRLLGELLNLFEALLRDDRVDEKEAVAALDPFPAYRLELDLACCVVDLQEARIAIKNHPFAVEILDGGIVFLHKVVTDQLNDERGLSHSRTAEAANPVRGHMLGCTEGILRIKKNQKSRIQQIYFWSRRRCRNHNQKN